jgi:hypothetical protein
MSMRNATEQTPAQWLSTVKRLIATLIILGLLLFVPAGRMTWTRGWIFLAGFHPAHGYCDPLLWAGQSGDVCRSQPGASGD